MYMRNAGDAEYPYYNIAIIRRTGEYDHFILMVMKSKTKSDEQFDKITASFVETECVGEAKNPETAYEFELPENWSEETRRYYELFSAAQNVSWGRVHQNHRLEEGQRLRRPPRRDHHQP